VAAGRFRFASFLPAGAASLGTLSERKESFSHVQSGQPVYGALLVHDNAPFPFILQGFVFCLLIRIAF
jgi:hypothetical protein